MEKYTNASHEVEVKDKDNYFNGFIDMIDKEGNIYDFKYCSTSTARRLDGRQLNFYRYLARVFLQLDIKKMFYVIIPKVNIRQKKTETLSAFRQRLIAECKEVRPYIQEVEYDPSAIEWFLDTIKKIESDKAFEKRESEQCRLCPYRVHCQESEVETMDEKKQVPGTQDPKSGTQTMKVGQMGVESETKAVENGTSSLLPKAERKARDKSSKIKMWIYGAPFSGKTTFANMADMPLFLNTDGNVKYIDAPAIIIKDGRKQIEGSRMSKKV